MAVESANDGSPVAIVTGDHRVCCDTCWETVVIFPHKVEGGGHGFGDVAGGTEALSDDVAIRLARRSPRLQYAPYS